MSEVKQYYIGWDVGAWNCDKNPNSRDAIVILNSELEIVGKPWRGNLSDSIIESVTTLDWIKQLFLKCKIVEYDSKINVVMAIDIPLGFPETLLKLLNSKTFTSLNSIEHKSNPYLFRQTEIELFKNDLQPLSSIKDMIGSQSTKGIHTVAKFARLNKECGIWQSEGNDLTTIETYPASCRNSKTLNSFGEKLSQEINIDSRFSEKAKVDIQDALTCALVAYLFSVKHNSLVYPNAEIPKSEGWIWYLKK